jgi:hypothetical protein
MTLTFLRGAGIGGRLGGATGQASCQLSILGDPRAKFLVKYQEETKNKQMRQGSGPRFRREVPPTPSVQAGSPLRPNRAALRAAQGFAPSLPALKNCGEK